MISFAIYLMCAYFATLIGFNLWIKKQSEKVLEYRLPAGVASFLFIPFTLGLAFCSIVFSSPSLAAYTWFLGISIAILYCTARFDNIKEKLIWMPLVCAAGTYALQKAVESQITLDYGIVIALVWTCIMGIVMFFDRLPLLNFLTVGTWALSFAAIGIISGTGAPAIAVLGLLLLAPLWAILSTLAKRLEGSLGPYASAFLGFIMGGMISVCLMAHSYGSALILMGYYLFELFFFVMGLLGFHPFGMQPGDFALGAVLAKNKPTPIIKVVFFRLLIMALIAALMWKINKIGVLSIIILIILADTYNRFNAAGAPPPTIRQMWSDTKNGLKMAWKSLLNMKPLQVAKKEPEEKKVVTPQKKSVKKKAVKRKKKK